MEKIVIIGAGHVGSHAARALAGEGAGYEVVLTDIVPGKAEAQAMDIADGMVPGDLPGTVRAGTLEDCADADVTVVCVGKAREKGQTRLDLLEDSVRRVHALGLQMKEAGVGGLVISITNPCDIVADILGRALGMDRTRVFGTGTLLDTMRLVRVLSAQTGEARSRIEACVLGEHGDSSMIPFSCVRVGGKRPEACPGFDAASALERTHGIGMDIIEGKGSTEFGIGQSVSTLIRRLLAGEEVRSPLSVRLEGEYGLGGISCGVPCRVSRRGILSVEELPLEDTEKEALFRSAEVIRRHTRMAEDLLGLPHRA